MRRKFLQMHCLNCQTPIVSNYCPACGQSVRVGRITGREIYKGILESVGNVDRGFLYTLVSLLRNPVALTRDYLSGKRVRHQKPMTFFLIITTAQVLLTRFTLAINNSASEAAFSGIPGGPDWLYRLIGNSPAFIALNLFPFLALGFYTGYRKHGHNIGEHFYISIFLFSFIQLLFLFTNLLALMIPGLQTFVGLLYIPVIYWFYYAMYRGKTRSILRGFLRTTASICLTLLFMMVFATVAFTLVVQTLRLFS